ncbi:MAG: GNAT family N-acetyltransferase [Clostridia bacterium]|nr:GNAT family N-acetyltransferase [Clostridia bacterium]
MSIQLRNWQETDAEALYHMCLDPAHQNSGLHTFPSLSECREAIRQWAVSDGFKVIADATTHALIGSISLGGMDRYEGYMELEFAIAAQHRGKGFCTEAVRRMLDYGFTDMNAQVIAAWVRSHNLACVRVLEKCGFTPEGRLRRHARDGSDTLCYSILKEEWERIQDNT